MQERKFRKKAFQFLFVIVIIICAFVIGKIIDSRQDLANKQAEHKEIQEKIEDESKRTEDLEDYQDYIGTDEFTEEQARGFGYVYPDEKVLKPEEDK